jgi:hypothetical protein
MEEVNGRPILNVHSKLTRRETTIATLVRSECIGFKAFLHRMASIIRIAIALSYSWLASCLLTKLMGPAHVCWNHIILTGDSVL